MGHGVSQLQHRPISCWPRCMLVFIRDGLREPSSFPFSCSVLFPLPTTLLAVSESAHFTEFLSCCSSVLVSASAVPSCFEYGPTRSLLPIFSFQPSCFCLVESMPSARRNRRPKLATPFFPPAARNRYSSFLMLVLPPLSFFFYDRCRRLPLCIFLLSVALICRPPSASHSLAQFVARLQVLGSLFFHFPPTPILFSS